MGCIGITMGCPVGIGPEIILKFFAARKSGPSGYRPVVLGDLSVMRRTAELLNMDLEIAAWHPGAPVRTGTVPVRNLSDLDPGELAWGRPGIETGRAMAGYIEAAVRMIRNNELAAMVTCPITKKALNLAGYDFPGHTEMLAALSGADEYLMMLAGDRLRVALVTIHEPISRVPELVSRQAVADCVRMTERGLREDFGMEEPRIAVAALNPHGGEQGMFGREEEKVIAPVIRSWNGPGRVSGPWPPDTVFHRAAAGEFDAVVAMYHDQGLIPFKLLHFGDGVNVTLGLPIVRTSVDHGTAYDIAGQGRAECTSLDAAFEMAAAIARNRIRQRGS